MKNIQTVKNQIAKMQIEKDALVNNFVLKNVKGGVSCPPPRFGG